MLKIFDRDKSEWSIILTKFDNKKMKGNKLFYI